MTLDTIPDIARASGFRPHQIRLIVKTREIMPDLRVGNLGVQLFGPTKVNRILVELFATARADPVPDIY